MQCMDTSWYSVPGIRASLVSSQALAVLVRIGFTISSYYVDGVAIGLQWGEGLRALQPASFKMWQNWISANSLALFFLVSAVELPPPSVNYDKQKRGTILSIKAAPWRHRIVV